VRFWNLGDLSLHGDEETMAMPALEILESGLPLQPSGMLYVRGLGQLYLMALSISMFGVSEWALRLPSAIVGSLGVLIAFFLGKRFLQPNFNLLFVVIIALYPSLIAYSQTARMYIFLSTFSMLYTVFIFRWEKKNSVINLTLALITFLVTIQFHQLGIFFCFMFFFPFLLSPSKKRMIQGSIAFCLACIFFLAFKKWVASNYTATLAATMPSKNSEILPFHLTMTDLSWAILLITIMLSVIVLLVFWHIYLKNCKMAIAPISIFLLIAAISACFFLQYYAAFLLFICGAIIHLRLKGNRIFLLVIAVFACLLFIIHFNLLYNSNSFTGTKDVLKILAGKPSPRIMFTVSNDFSLIVLLYCLLILYSIWQIVKGYQIPDHFLLFIITVFIPITGIGFFAWSVPGRYIGQITPFFIISFLAGVNYFIANTAQLRKPDSPWRSIVVPLILLIVIINPFELKKAVYAEYKMYPDHKGAATYMKSLQLKSEDIIIAEDVLQQTFYLGKVDYWLRAFNDARKFVQNHNGNLIDIYTGTPLIGTGEELEDIFKSKICRTVYIIGAGQKGERNVRFLGDGILETINKYETDVIFKGRDGQTTIRQYRNPNCSIQP
jgi:hypothetical protein